MTKTWVRNQDRVSKSISVSSMIGSVVESLVSSMTIAQSFIDQEQKDGEMDEAESADGVNSFTRVCLKH